MKKILVVIVLLSISLLFINGCVETSDHEHSNDDEHAHESTLAFEWAGVFYMPKGEYSWTMQKVEGEFADPAMKMLVMKTDTADFDGIVLKKDIANNLFESNAVTVNDGDMLIPGTNLYNLILDDTKEEVSFRVNIEENGAYIFFTEHFPYEFEATEHFLKDLNRENVEPSAENPSYEAYLEHMKEHGKEVYGHEH